MAIKSVRVVAISDNSAVNENAMATVAKRASALARTTANRRKAVNAALTLRDFASSSAMAIKTISEAINGPCTDPVVQAKTAPKPALAKTKPAAEIAATVFVICEPGLV